MLLQLQVVPKKITNSSLMYWGCDLLKKTVNQDDIQTYHLFFADDVGGAGTDMTFFDFPNIQKGTHGTNEIYRTVSVYQLTKH